MHAGKGFVTIVHRGIWTQCGLQTLYDTRPLQSSIEESELSDAYTLPISMSVTIVHRGIWTTLPLYFFLDYVHVTIVHRGIWTFLLFVLPCYCLSLQSSIEESEHPGGHGPGLRFLVTIVHRGIWTCLAKRSFQELRVTIVHRGIWTNEVYIACADWNFGYNRP